MIYITGDTHGEIDRFSRIHLPNEQNWNKEDYLIICGDFGFIFDNDKVEKFALDELEKKPYHILWIDGNHENFNAIDEYPIEEWNGGKAHRIRKNILHLMRGQVFEIDNKKFFTMGGAYSIDRYMRKEGASWWPQEIPSNEEYHEAIENLKKHNNKIDYVITHTAPKEIVLRMGYNPDKHDLQLVGFLEWVMYECDYKHWYFGHWHIDDDITDKVTALFYDVVKLN